MALDIGRVVERLGTEAARDSSAEALMRSPYSAQTYQDLGVAIVRQVRSLKRSPAKVIAVDCDNTLWGGILGEVGPDGIEVGDDGRGHAFRLFQQQLKRIQEKGVLLAVVSRNAEAEVREVFEQHPGMVLRPDDIAAWRVGWSYKSESLREIAAALNLGLDSFVFLDDDPAVRLEVESRVPEVHVVPLPGDPALYCDTLNRLWLFDGVAATDVDAKRTELAHQEAERQAASRSAASLDDYLRSLELVVDIGAPNERDWARVAQLTQRTNQFNSSLKRRTVGELKALGRAVQILTLDAHDRYGGYGLTGVAVLDGSELPDVYLVDTWLMSCRVLGRGVEDAFLYEMARTAADLGARALAVPFEPGPRNDLILDYLKQSGFQEVRPNRWELPLAVLPPRPPYLEINRHGAERLVAAG